MTTESPGDDEHPWVAPDGRALRLRPVRSGDAERFREAFERLSREEVIARFFTPVKSIDHLLGGYTHPDFTHHIAFVLVDEEELQEGGSILGVIRLVADTNGTAAEFSIIIDKALYGVGLGGRLLRYLASCAHARSITDMYGYVSKENLRMARLCLRLGFERQAVPSDPTITRFSVDPANIVDTGAH